MAVLQTANIPSICRKEFHIHRQWISPIHAAQVRTVTTRMLHHQIFWPVTFDPSLWKKSSKEILTAHRQV